MFGLKIQLVLAVILLVLGSLNFCHGATLRQLVASKSKPENPNLLEPKFLRADVLKDHMMIFDDRTSSFDPLRPGNEFRFQIPLQNARQVDSYHIRDNINDAGYGQMKELLVHRIMTRQLTNQANKDLELLLLDKHGVVMSCKWFYMLPPPFNDDQCTMKELQDKLAVKNG